MDLIRDERLSRALADAMRTGSYDRLRDVLERVSGLPSKSPSLSVAEAVARVCGAAGRPGQALLVAMKDWEDPFANIIIAIANGVVLAATADAKALDEILTFAEDEKLVVRSGAIEALTIAMRGRPALLNEVGEGWTGSYLGLHGLLEVVTAILPTLHDHERVRELFWGALLLSDEAPRAAERSQGLRTLREGLARQLAVVVPRLREGWELAEEAATLNNPASREIIAAVIKGLQKGGARNDDVAKLRTLHEKHAPLPRDPTLIRQGMRRRGKKR